MNTDLLIEQCMDILIGAKLAKTPQIVFQYYRDRNEWQAFALDDDDTLKKNEVCFEGNFICGYGKTASLSVQNFKTNLLHAFNEIYKD